MYRFPVQGFMVVLAAACWPKLAEAVSGSNVCPTDTGQSACCYNYYEVEGRCVECPLGFYGDQCKSKCVNGFYGKQCKYRCVCKPRQYCDRKEGCKCQPDDRQCQGITTTPPTTTTKKSTTTKTTVTTTIKTTTRKPQTVSTAKYRPTSERPNEPQQTTNVTTLNDVIDEARQQLNNSLSKFAQVKDDSGPTSFLSALGGDNHLLIVIAICSSGVAAFLIVVVLVIFIRSKLKKKRKRETTGRSIEQHSLSVMSKVYDEINDSLLRPSCSNEMPGPSCAGATGGYESLADMKGKGMHEKGNRGSYELLDEATKGAKNRESYQLLDEATTAAKEYASLNTHINEPAYSSLNENANLSNETKLKVSLDANAEDKEGFPPEYTQVVRRKKSKGSQNEKGKKQNDGYKVPDDYLKPPPLPQCRKETGNTKVDEVPTPKAEDGDVNEGKLVLEVDASPSRQLTKSVINFSYEIPPLPKGKNEDKTEKKSCTEKPCETEKGQGKSNPDERENSDSSNDAQVSECRAPSGSEKAGSNENYDTPLKLRIDTEKKSEVEIDRQSYDIPPEKETNTPKDKSTTGKGTPDKGTIDASGSGEQNDYDAPPKRSGVKDVAQDEDNSDNYDVPSKQTKTENRGENYDTPPVRNECNKITKRNNSHNLKDVNDSRSSCDYDTPPPQHAGKNESLGRENYDIPPPKKT